MLVAWFLPRNAKIAPRPVSKVTFPPGGMVPGHGSTTCGQKVAWNSPSRRKLASWTACWTSPRHSLHTSDLQKGQKGQGKATQAAPAEVAERRSSGDPKGLGRWLQARAALQVNGIVWFNPVQHPKEAVDTIIIFLGQFWAQQAIPHEVHVVEFAHSPHEGILGTHGCDMLLLSVVKFSVYTCNHQWIFGGWKHQTYHGAQSHGSHEPTFLCCCSSGSGGGGCLQGWCQVILGAPLIFSGMTILFLPGLQRGWSSHSATQPLCHSARVARPATLPQPFAAQSLRVAEWLSGWSSLSGRVAEWLSGCFDFASRVAHPL